MNNIEEIVKKLVSNLVLENEKGLLNENTNLKKDLNLDSISLIGLIMDLNNEFNIEIKSEEIIDQNFETIKKIADFVSSKI